MSSNFVLYFSKNQIKSDKKEGEEIVWSMDNFIKSDVIIDTKDIGGFINYAIRNPKTRIINMHDFGFYMFREGFPLLKDDYIAKGLTYGKDFGEIRIKYKFGNIRYYVSHPEKPWAATYNEKTYNNMYKFFEDILTLTCVINMDDYNFSGISILLKDDVAEFRYFIYQYEKEKYEKAKLLIKSFIEHEKRLNQCPYTSDRMNYNGHIEVAGINYEYIPLTEKDELFYKKAYYNQRNNYNYNNYNHFRREENKDEKEKEKIENEENNKEF